MLLVLTPLAQERELLSQYLTETGWQPQIEKNGYLTGIVFKEHAVRVFTGGHGKSQFALQTQHLLHHLPETTAVLCVGAAGSLTKPVKPGDLVVAEQTIEHDFHLKFIQRPLPTFPADEKLLARARQLKSSGLSLHFGAIASGDEDIIDEARAEELAQKTSALAVAWEGAGGARACLFHRLPYMEVRAVTDFADKQARADFKTHLKTGMFQAARFLQEWLKVDKDFQ